MTTEASIKDIVLAVVSPIGRPRCCARSQPAADVAQFRPEVWMWVSLLLVVAFDTAG